MTRRDNPRLRICSFFGKGFSSHHYRDVFISAKGELEKLIRDYETARGLLWDASQELKSWERWARSMCKANCVPGQRHAPNCPVVDMGMEEDDE